MGRWTLVLGGARSGKSRFTLERAKQLQNGGEVVYLASGLAFDEEMKQRIARHRSDRPRDWRTVEESVRIASELEDLGKEKRLIVWDCVTLYLNNLIFQWEKEQNGKKVKRYPEELEEMILSQVGQIASLKKKMQADLILVSNEVGGGLVPENELGRFFRDVAGRANQTLAAAADEVFLVAAGIPVKIK